MVSCPQTRRDPHAQHSHRRGRAPHRRAHPPDPEGGGGTAVTGPPTGTRPPTWRGSGRYDLALVDVMLPGSDGFALLDYCKGLDLPVIFVTARSAVADRVRGLHAGAEDYIVKPFDAAELLARVETVLRRFHKAQATLSLAGVTADPRARRAWRGGGGGGPHPPRSLTCSSSSCATPTPPSTGTPSMNRCGAGSWPTAARRWTSTSSGCGKRWGGRTALRAVHKVGYRLEVPQ